VTASACCPAAGRPERHRGRERPMDHEVRCMVSSAAASYTTPYQVWKQEPVCRRDGGTRNWWRPGQVLTWRQISATKNERYGSVRSGLCERARSVEYCTLKTLAVSVPATVLSREYDSLPQGVRPNTGGATGKGRWRGSFTVSATVVLGLQARPSAPAPARRQACWTGHCAPVRSDF